MMASLLMTACVVGPPGPYYGQPVRVAPPPPQYEYPGYPPFTDYVWISGYWGWGGARYAWVPGRWEAPRRGYLWVPHRWERSGDSWRQSGGRWENDARPRPAPAPRMEAQPMPRPERDNPPRRQWEGDSPNSRSGQLRSEQQPAPHVERDNSPGYAPRDNGRPAASNPASRPERDNAARPESRSAPVTGPSPERSRVGRGERSPDDARDDSRSKRRRSADDGQG